MTNTNSEHLADLLESCIANLEAGMTMEETLEKAAEHKEEIQPLLETAMAARYDDIAKVPASIQNRSRTRMLARAEELRIEKKIARSKTFPWLRLSMQLLTFLAVVGVSLTSLIAASAKSVPGDNLYSIKRFGENTRLSISSAPGRTQLEQTYRIRRIDEIKELLILRRTAPIVFEGVVTEQATERWVIGGLDVVITPNTQTHGDITQGTFVEVQGRTIEGEIIASNVYLRSYAFLGTIEEISGQIWIVSGVPVLVTENSQVAPAAVLGTEIVVLAQVDNEGTVSARAILLADGPEGLDIPTSDDLGTATSTPAPSATASPTATPSPTLEETNESEETEEAVETQEITSTPDSEDEPDETEEPEDTDEPDETGTPDPTETDEPDETNTPDPTETDEPDETDTPEPTDTEEPDETKTPEPTKTPDDD